jgi:homocysteine S-methyltransferase
LNKGYDIAGNPIGEPTGWHVGVGADPGMVDLSLEIDRLYQKVEAGAEYILTQPVFEVKQLENFLNRIQNIDTPILAGIMPLMSYRTIEYLNNEVPGVTVPDEIADRMYNAKDASHAKKLGVEIAQAALLQTKQFEKVKGIYLMPPFTKDKYSVAIDVLNVLR